MKLISHYTNLKTFLNHILENKTFQLNLISRTNDPHEHIKRFNMGYANLKLQNKKLLNHAYSLYETVPRDKIKVGCFVKEDGVPNKFETWKSVLNLPLWAHYGENGEGVALVFDSEKLIESCKSVVEYDWAIFYDNVKYPPSLKDFELPFVFNFDDIDDKSDEGIIKHIFNKASKLWSHKNKLWSYENEYRILIYSSEDEPVKINIEESLYAVVFGDKVSSIVKELVGRYCNSIDIKTFYVEFSELENDFILYPNNIV